MFATLKAKIISTLIVIAILTSGVFYVRSLQHKITNLQTNVTQLSEANKSLNDTLDEITRMQLIVDKVSVAGDKERQKNIAIRNKQQKQIDDSVNAGEDKPVGKLLKDFLNEPQ